jgi:glutathione S-transferase
MTALHLYFAKASTFAQRTRAVLLEKGIEFTSTEIDFQNKSAEFLKVSRNGKVPAIVLNGFEIYESAIINEFRVLKLSLTVNLFGSLYLAEL